MGTWASVAEGTTTAPEWLMPGNSTQWQAYLVYSPILASPILEASNYFPSTGFESPGKLPTVGPTKVASLGQPPLAPARQEPTQLKQAGQVCCGRAWQNLQMPPSSTAAPWEKHFRSIQELLQEVADCHVDLYDF